MMARSLSRGLAALLGLTILGCSSSALTHRTWDSLSEEELQTRLSSPTADLSSRLTTQQVSGLEARMPVLLEIGRLVGHVIGAVTEVTNTDYSDEEARLPEVDEPPAQETGWGTNLYLRVACPGADPAKPRGDFSAGSVRLDSARIRSSDLRELIEGGEFLLSFEACQLGSMRVDARFPGRYTADVARLAGGIGEAGEPAFAMALSADEVEQGTTASPLGMLMVGCGSEGACDEDLRVAAEFRTEAGSFVISFQALRSFWSGGSLKLTIQGSDSLAECEYTRASAGPRLTCDAE